MFTGIIQSLGFVENIDIKKNIYVIKTDLNLKDCNVGSSICCDGVCLTAIEIIKVDSHFFFSVNVGEETIKKSNLVNWKINKKINLEKSIKVGDEISGHFVYGHVDDTLFIKNIRKLKNSWEFEFSFLHLSNNKNTKKFIVEKGSVSINGISLTVASVFKDSFKISIIPYTFINTNLSNLNINDIVNIEFDPLARYIYGQYEK